MRNDLYTESGLPLGFHDDTFVYDRGGCLVGRLKGSRVYCMAGHYVGKLENGVVRGVRHNHSSEERRSAIIRSRGPSRKPR